MPIYGDHTEDTRCHQYMSTYWHADMPIYGDLCICQSLSLLCPYMEICDVSDVSSVMLVMLSSIFGVFDVSDVSSILGKCDVSDVSS